MKKFTFTIILMMITFHASAQTCPGTLANQTTATEPFFKIDQGTTDCVDWPMTITINGSVFEQTSCSGANLQYVLISGPALTDANNFVADFGFGECTYVNGTLSGQTLSVEEIEQTSTIIYPNPVKKSVKVSVSFGTPISGEISVYNINGLLIQKLLVKAKSSLEIDTAALRSGIYFVKILTKNQRFDKKLIVF